MVDEFLFLQIAEKRFNQIRISRAPVRLSINEEANTKYGIGSRGTVRVGTGF